MKLKYTPFLCFLFLAYHTSAQVKTERERNEDQDSVRTVFDERPHPDYNFGKYLNDNLHYPDSARVHDIEGQVRINFVVKKNGTIAKCYVAKSVNKYLDEEALRVICSMPPWQPGKLKGKIVKVYFQQPVTFRLE